MFQLPSSSSQPPAPPAAPAALAAAPALAVTGVQRAETRSLKPSAELASLAPESRSALAPRATEGPEAPADVSAAMVGQARQKHSLLQKAPRPVREASRPTARMVDSAVGSVALGQSGKAQGASEAAPACRTAA